jgi:hypothetical protein
MQVKASSFSPQQCLYVVTPGLLGSPEALQGPPYVQVVMSGRAPHSLLMNPKQRDNTSANNLLTRILTSRETFIFFIISAFVLLSGDGEIRSGRTMSQCGANVWASVDLDYCRAKMHRDDLAMGLCSGMSSDRLKD